MRPICRSPAGPRCSWRDFAAAAVIDRIVHGATVLTTNGDSYRLKAAQRNRDGPRSPEDSALMGTRRDVASRRSAVVRPRRDDHPTEGSLFTLPKGPFSPCHFQFGPTSPLPW